MRPRSLEEFLGQAHLLGPGKILRKAIEAGELHSMILWGPPGSGKTTLALLLADDPWSVERMLEATSVVVCSEQAAEKLRGTLPPTVEVIMSNRTIDRAGIDLLRDVLARLDEPPRAAAR